MPNNELSTATMPSSEQTRYASRVVERAAWSRIEQGTIFSGAIAENYVDSETYGLVITARCDLAQMKASIVNYVPVVPFREWARWDGAILLCEQIRKDVVGRLRGILREHSLSETLLVTQPPRRILNTCFDKKSTDSAARKRAVRCAEVVDQLDALTAIGARAVATPGDLDALCKMGPKLSNDLVVKCMTQQLSGYYFLPGVGPNTSPVGYVALLREIYHLPTSLALAVASGLDNDRYDVLCRETPSLKGRLLLRTDNFAMPMGTLRSPHLEHLMQAFSHLYGRIGLEDIAPEYVSFVRGQAFGESV